MKRRVLLAAMTGGLAGLAGCQGFGGSGRRDEPYEVPPRETTSERTTEPIPGIEPRTDPESVEPLSRVVSTQIGEGRRIAIADPPLSNSPGPGRYTVGFTTEPSLSTPATVWVEFTSTAEDTRTYEFGPSPPFSNYWGARTGTERSARGLLLVPIDERPFPYGYLTPGAPTNGRWEATDSLGDPERPLEPTSVELDPGESIVGEYVLLRPPGAGAFPDRSTYAFEGGEWTGATLTISTWDPSLLDGRESRFEGRTVPDLPYSAPTQWFHRPDEGIPSVFLDPSRERLILPEFILVPEVENFAPESVGVGRFSVFKLENGQWFRVGPFRTSPTPARYLAPGGSQKFSFTVTRTFADGLTSGVAGPSATLKDLGSGTYAVAAVTFGIPAQNDPQRPVVLDASDPSSGESRLATREDPTVLGALVEVVGDPASVTPSKDASYINRDDGALSVKLLPPESDPDGEGRPRASELLVYRSPSVTPSRELIAEQVLQFPALRTALGNFDEDVDVVRVVADETTARRPIEVFGDVALFRFSFQGEIYVAQLTSTDDETAE